MKSFLSRAVVAGVLLTSAAGWIGSQGEPAAQAQAAGEQVASAAGSAQAGERDRSAWQPSPIPSGAGAGAILSSAQSSTSIAPAAQPVAVAAPAGAVPVAPAAPVTPPAAPGSVLDRFAGWLKGIAGVSASGAAATGATAASPTIEPLPGAGTVIPMASLFSHDALEAEFAGGLPSARGEWRTVTLFSRALNREATYMAYLPPGYASSAASGRTYPTLYLLHGVGSETAYGVEEWLGYALTEDLDRLLALGLIEPMIVILPNGEQGYWMNHADGGPQWADFVAKDLVTHVDATFRTTATRETRAIGGLSMGGHGAVQIAYNHPELFSVAGAHSPTIRSYQTSPEFFGDPQHFAQYDPVSLALRGAAGRVLSWIDVGANDQWRSGAEALAQALASRQAPVQFRVIEGEHEGWYWKYYLPEYLYFYSSALGATSHTTAGAPVVAGQLLSPAAAPVQL